MRLRGLLPLVGVAVLVSLLRWPYCLYMFALLCVWLGARWWVQRRRKWFAVRGRQHG